VLPLTAEHKRQRLDWCQTREQWDIEWNIIVFSYESPFVWHIVTVGKGLEDDVVDGVILSFLWCVT
jgi:hypothetical protein